MRGLDVRISRNALAALDDVVISIAPATFELVGALPIRVVQPRHPRA